MSLDTLYREGVPLKIILVKQGKVVLPGIRDLCSMYETRLKRFYDIESVEQKSTSQKSAAKPGTITIALDEHGKQWNTKELAAKIQDWTDDPRIKTLRFVVGDAHGLSQDIRDTADFTWAISKLTLQGDLAWLLLWEQVYRAITLNKGIPYHHE